MEGFDWTVVITRLRVHPLISFFSFWIYSRTIFVFFIDLDLLFHVAFNSQDHIVTGSLWVEEPVHTSWSRLCTVNHQASASNYQLFNMKCPGRDSNW